MERSLRGRSMEIRPVQLGCSTFGECKGSPETRQQREIGQSALRVRRPLFPDGSKGVHLRILPSATGMAIAESAHYVIRI